MTTKPRPTFSLRFRKPQTQRAAQIVAKHRRISMNAFVEEAVEAHLMVEAPLVEWDLRAAMHAVQVYTDHDVDHAIEEFASAEVTHDDLFRPEGVLPDSDDAFGVKSAFEDVPH